MLNRSPRKRIYTREDIEKCKASPSFEREYNLKYLGKVGNAFHTLDIEAAICTQQEGQEMMDWSTSIMVGRSMGIDVAWGDTSKFAIVITQHRNRKVEVFYAESFEKPQMNHIINHIMQLKEESSRGDKIFNFQSIEVCPHIASSKLKNLQVEVR